MKALMDNQTLYLEKYVRTNRSYPKFLAEHSGSVER